MRNINRINDVVKGKTVTAALNTTKTLGNAWNTTGPDRTYARK
jgi:hypothetical protein